jgi:adenylate kinase
MKNIVLFGPPGSGKGTQAANIIAKYNLIHLSTGDMLRAEIAEQTKLGLEAKSLMDKGELVPDAVVVGMIDNKLNANPNAAGFVFDGFPRTVAQAAALDELLANRDAPIQKVLSLKVSEQELTKRILERGKTSGRADDQNEEIVKNRVEEYRTKTEPLAAYYAKQGKLVEIQGEGTVDHINDLLNYEIDNISNGTSSGGFIHNLVDKIFHHKAKEEAKAPAPKETEAPKALPAAEPEVKKPAPKKAAPAKPAAKAEVKAPAKKAAPKKAAVKKAAPKAAKKAASKPVAKKAAPKAAKKSAPKKAVKKVAPKKAVKKVAPKKVVKKAAPKKVVKKVAPKKVVKKAAPKKVVKKAAPKKAVKKAAAKKAIKKVAPKKVVKKVAPKKAVKKVAAKKAVKKAAPKKVAKKAVKKVVKKAAPKKAAKKPVAKKVAKKVAAKKKKK